MTTEEKKQSLVPQNMDIDHAHILVRYQTETGKILPRKFTRLSAKQQRKVKRSIKRGRNMLKML